MESARYENWIVIIIIIIIIIIVIAIQRYSVS